MQIEKFVKKLKECKRSQTQTGFFKVKVRVSKERTEAYIYSIDVCSKCKREEEKGVRVDFNEPQENLSIFQVEMLYSLYCLNKKPFDYASYHKCKAGIKFIENIKKIEVC